MWRPSRRSSPDALAAVVVLTAAVAAAAALYSPLLGSEGGNLVAQAHEILSGGGYQTSMPVGPARRTPPNLNLGRFARIVVYAVILYAILLVAIWLYGRLARRDAVATGGAGGGKGGQGGGDAIAAGGAEAERLAREGRFGEAAHLLLLVSIRHLSLRRMSDPAPSSTSRELVRTLPATPEERAAFSRLVRLVELSFFGGRSMSATDYDDSRRCFAALHPGALR